MNNINNNKFNDIENNNKIFIYKTSDCYIKNNYIYCDNMKKNIIDPTLNIKDSKSIKNNIVKDTIETTEMEKILCYTY
jgi:hypothetical protein